MKAIEFSGNLNDFLSKYEYQPRLTQKLDNLSNVDFTQHLVDEIVLWKVDRYVSLDEDLLQHLNQIKTLTQGEHRKGEQVLIDLLRVHGIDLAMASTILRFRNPHTFQIIDRHAYRAVYGKKFPLYAASHDSRKVAVYFDYLDELLRLCAQRDLEFRTIDRLLYIFDKGNNGKL